METLQLSDEMELGEYVARRIGDIFDDLVEYHLGQLWLPGLARFWFGRGHEDFS